MVRDDSVSFKIFRSGTTLQHVKEVSFNQFL